MQVSSEENGFFFFKIEAKEKVYRFVGGPWLFLGTGCDKEMDKRFRPRECLVYGLDYFLSVGEF